MQLAVTAWGLSPTPSQIKSDHCVVEEWGRLITSLFKRLGTGYPFSHGSCRPLSLFGSLWPRGGVFLLLLGPRGAGRRSSASVEHVIVLGMEAAPLSDSVSCVHPLFSCLQVWLSKWYLQVARDVHLKVAVSKASPFLLRVSIRDPMQSG